jgi:hypothetical protein
MRKRTLALKQEIGKTWLVIQRLITHSITGVS